MVRQRRHRYSAAATQPGRRGSRDFVNFRVHELASLRRLKERARDTERDVESVIQAEPQLLPTNPMATPLVRSIVDGTSPPGQNAAATSGPRQPHHPGHSDGRGGPLELLAGDDEDEEEKNDDHDRAAKRVRQARTTVVAATVKKARPKRVKKAFPVRPGADPVSGWFRDEVGERVRQDTNLTSTPWLRFDLADAVHAMGLHLQGRAHRQERPPNADIGSSTEPRPTGTTVSDTPETEAWWHRFVDPSWPLDTAACQRAIDAQMVGVRQDGSVAHIGVRCRKCRSFQVTYTRQQTRRADEMERTDFLCERCGHIWREG